MSDGHLSISSIMDTFVLKIVAVLTLLVATLLCSLFPLIFRFLGQNQSPRFPWIQHHRAILIQSLSCFGGGIFLGTCLLDLIPDARKSTESAFAALNWQTLDFPLSHFMTCVGFILVLIIEQVLFRF